MPINTLFLRKFIFKKLFILISGIVTLSLISFLVIIPRVEGKPLPIEKLSAEHLPIFENTALRRDLPEFSKKIGSIHAYPSSRSDNLEIPIYIYHYIKEYSNPHDVLGERLSVSPKNFDLQMSFLKDNGYETISFIDLYNSLHGDFNLPVKPIILSFDDGYDNMHSAAYPILQKYGFIGSFAIITDRVGSPGYMNWNQIKELKNSGNEISSHSVSHPDLSQVSYVKLSSELLQSKETLDNVLHQDTKVLIYPSGKYNENVVKQAAALGYIIARTTEPGVKENLSNLMLLPGIRIFNSSRID